MIGTIGRLDSTQYERVELAERIWRFGPPADNPEARREMRWRFFTVTRGSPPASRLLAGRRHEPRKQRQHERWPLAWLADAGQSKGNQFRDKQGSWRRVGSVSGRLQRCRREKPALIQRVKGKGCNVPCIALGTIASVRQPNSRSPCLPSSDLVP